MRFSSLYSSLQHVSSPSIQQFIAPRSYSSRARAAQSSPSPSQVLLFCESGHQPSAVRLAHAFAPSNVTPRRKTIACPLSRHEYASPVPAEDASRERARPLRPPRGVLLGQHRAGRDEHDGERQEEAPHGDPGEALPPAAQRAHFFVGRTVGVDVEPVLADAELLPAATLHEIPSPGRRERRRRVVRAAADVLQVFYSSFRCDPHVALARAPITHMPSTTTQRLVAAAAVAGAAVACALALRRAARARASRREDVPAALRARYEAAGQAHVFEWLDAGLLTAAAARALVEQLAAIDLGHVAAVRASALRAERDGAAALGGAAPLARPSSTRCPRSPPRRSPRGARRASRASRRARSPRS